MRLSLKIDDFNDDADRWFHDCSNVILDFHGNPFKAELVVFSDGNHHMALKETLTAFQADTPDLKHIFYATTPPAPIVTLLKGGTLQLGNFQLTLQPDIFISPPHILEALALQGHVHSQIPFVVNQGNVLLVKKGNPKQITAVPDLVYKDCTLFLSNPDTETASYTGYRDTLVNLSRDKNIIDKLRIIHGTQIHHREAASSIHDGDSDAAILYYHLAIYFKKNYPDEFDIIPLGGTVKKPDPIDGNIICRTSVSLAGDGGAFGLRFFNFLKTDKTKSIYRHHGLVPC